LLIENILIVLAVLAILSLVTWWTQKPEEPKFKRDKNVKISDLNLLFDRARSEFSEYTVFKRHDKVLICEISKLRGEPRELVFIRLVSESKSVRISSDGKHLIARYPHVPTKQEMRKDFAQMLNKH
jgi:FtsZ-interacting cell division protein ZipA